MVKVEKFNHEVKRVHVMQTTSAVPMLVCVDCCDKAEDAHGIHWHDEGNHVGVFALPDGRYLHVGEQATVGPAPDSFAQRHESAHKTAARVGSGERWGVAGTP